MSEKQTPEVEMLKRFSVNDEVIVTIPNNSDGKKLKTVSGNVVRVEEDMLGEVTGNPRDSFLYIVELENGDEFRGRDSDLDFHRNKEQNTEN